MYLLYGSVQEMLKTFVIKIVLKRVHVLYIVHVVVEEECESGINIRL